MIDEEFEKLSAKFEVSKPLKEMSCKELSRIVFTAGVRLGLAAVMDSKLRDQLLEELKNEH
jgi:hypothetical protein